MAVYHNVLVDIPDDKGVHVKSAGAKSEKYVYKYFKHYRNDKGDPRHKAKSIGKLDPISGKMYPNNHYYEQYRLIPSLPDIGIWDYGYSYVIVKACHDMGLLECLTNAFGKTAMDVVVMAAYIIREGNAMDGIDDWQGRNLFPEYDRLLTSQSTSRIFASLAFKQQEDFFKLWVKRALGNSAVCYDVTSISSYAQGMPSVERGYNRDGDNLAQFNLGMFCTEDTKLPIYYNRYNGSLTDKTNLSYVLDNAKAVGIERVKLIIDGGFWCDICFASLSSLCEAFTVGMPPHLKESERILSDYGENIEKYSNELSIRHVYCVPVDSTISGVQGRIMLYCDSWNRINLCEELSNKIDRLSAELRLLKRYPKSKLNRYTPYFILTKHEQGSGFDFQVDHEKVEALRKYKGFFLIFTTDRNASPDEILRYYRDKDAIEKLFAQIKVHMDVDRTRTHNDATTDDKTFVTFVACAIRAYLTNRLSTYLKASSTSMKKAFNQLSNITIISSDDGFRFAKALTKKQKQILDSFDAADDILASIDNIDCIR